jgi:RimJ/RimL family protein N-acetyltransferase
MADYTPARVRIERIRQSHSEAAFEAALESIAETFPWMEWCHPGLTLRELSGFLVSLEEAWAQDKAYTFSIFDDETGRYLGAGGLNRIDRVDQIANLHYWVRTSSVRRGVATSASRQFAHFGFLDLELQRIEIVIPTGNTASIRVAEKLGALNEGILRNRARVHGKPADAIMYCLLPPDGGMQAAA